MVRIIVPVVLVATSFLGVASASSAAAKDVAAPTPRSLRVLLADESDNIDEVVVRNLSSDSQDEYQDDAVAYYDDADSNVWTETKERITSDLVNMWSVAPNEWSDEYFEVLGGILAITLTAFAMLLLICCTPCCTPVDEPNIGHPKLQTVTSMTDASTTRLGLSQEERQQQEKEEALLETIASEEHSESAGQRAAMPDDKSNVQRSMQEDDFSAEEIHQPKRRKVRRKRKTMWTEVVSVWREFLTDSHPVEKDERQRHKKYYKYEEKHVSRGSFA
jgi:hypothetical protein